MWLITNGEEVVYWETISKCRWLPFGVCPLIPPPRPPFSGPKCGRRAGIGKGLYWHREGPTLSAIPIPGVIGQHRHTDLRRRRGLTSFSFSPRPKGNKQTVSGQAERTRTRGTWANTGSWSRESGASPPSSDPQLPLWPAAALQQPTSISWTPTHQASSVTSLCWYLPFPGCRVGQRPDFGVSPFSSGSYPYNHLSPSFFCHQPRPIIISRTVQILHSDLTISP